MWIPPQYSGWTELQKSMRSDVCARWTFAAFPDVVFTAKDAIVALTAARFVELSEEGPVVISELKSSMDLICSLHSMKFHKLKEESEFAFQKSIWELTYIVLLNCPCQSFINSVDENSGYDEFTTDGVGAVASFCRSTIMSGSHDHIFCSAVQYWSWLRAFWKGAGDWYDGSKSVEAGK